jgi:hypothetical protein
MSEPFNTEAICLLTAVEARYVGICAAITMIGVAGDCGLRGAFTPAFAERIMAISNDPELQALPGERLATLADLEEFITMILDSTGCP